MGVYGVTVVGEGFTVALAVGEAVGDAVGEFGVELPAMAHEPAVDTHVVGAMNLPLSVMPMLAEAPGARTEFHERLVAERRPLLKDPVAFHMLMLVPDHGIVTDQPLIGDVLVFVTVRSTFRPEPQSEVTLTATVSAADEVGKLVVVELGDAVGAGALVTAGEGATVGVAVGTGVEAVVGFGAGVAALLGAPTTEQVPAGIAQVKGARDPPRGAPRNPKVVEAPLASDALQLGPANRYPAVVGVLVASHTEVIEFE